MANNPVGVGVASWRSELPVLAARLVVLRELAPSDLGALVDLLSIGDASRFGLEYPVSDLLARQFIERTLQDRAAGASFTYAITGGASRPLVGVVQVRQLEPSFETAEWECTLAPSSRGTGVFLEAAKLAGSFTFGSASRSRSISASRSASASTTASSRCRPGGRGMGRPLI